MDRSIYTAMTGATQTLRAQAVNSHNLANASTVGFKAELAAQRAANVDGATLQSRASTLLGGLGFDPSSGALMATGNPTDVALAPDHWLAVQAADGSEVYTRAGDIRTGPDGLMRTGAGHIVLGDGGPLSVPPSSKVDIGGDGTVTVLPLGQEASAPVTVGRLRVVEGQSEQMERRPDGLFGARADVELEPAAGSVVVSGHLEGSNVNLAQSMVNMIELSRNFEMQVRMMRTAESNDEAAASMMRLGG